MTARRRPSGGAPPLVSVLMPAYEAGPFLRQAIDSVLGQSLADLELVLVDDGSTDDSAAIIAGCDDPRVVAVRNERNLGVIRSLNRGLDLARGRYLARMDADDVSLPERLARQVAFLEAHPELGGCGSWLETFGEAPGGEWRFPTRPDALRCRLLFETALAHPTVCVRRESFARHDLRFDPAYPHAEDYALWWRASGLFPLANLGVVLLRHRIHAGSVSRRHRRVQEATRAKIHAEALELLGVAPTVAELALHSRLAGGAPGDEPPALPEAEAWLRKLLDVNRRRRVLPTAALEAEVGLRWLRAAQQGFAAGRPALARFLRSPLARHVPLGARARLLARATRRALRLGARAPAVAPPQLPASSSRRSASSASGPWEEPR